MFPPEKPSAELRCSTLVRLFRPEFVKVYSKQFEPLSPDAFSGFSKGTDGYQHDNDQIIKATDYLLNVEIPLCVAKLESFASIDPFAFIVVFHRYGINLRHLGKVRSIDHYHFFQ